MELFRSKKVVFESQVNTKDLKLTRGKHYTGEVVDTPQGLRVRIQDNSGKSETFDPKVFRIVSVSN